jgi:murein L,D-transpeptidase YcbB/YkuD
MPQYKPFLLKFRLSIAVVFIAALWVMASFGYSAAQIGGASVLGALEQGRGGEGRLLDRVAMRGFYEHRGDAPFWLASTGAGSKARVMLDRLENAWTHGLNPDRYHVATIRGLMDKRDEDSRLRLELLLSDAFMRYAQDLSGMRVSPEGMNIDPDSWRKTMAPEAALALLAGGSNIDTILKTVEPQGKTYRLLRAELTRLMQEPPAAYEAVLPITMNGIMRPGWSHKTIAAIRTRLGVQPQTDNVYLYDDRLAAAVMKFQRENGLQDDGVIGSDTLHLLNRTKQDKILQIIVNLERLRWVSEAKPERFVVVNIPAATLWAIDRGRVQFEMPVVVGNPGRRTQSFIAEITGVRFNPDWTIPPTIKRYDILPKILAEPDYLQGKGIELVSGYGHEAVTVDPNSIDWENIPAKELNALRMIQVPGEHNPLGHIRILMPNKYNIYLHDTNHPELFNSQARAQSSGCIRLKDPEKMAAFVMNGQQGWALPMMQEILQTGATTDLAISRPIPVYVLYYTAWADAQGRVVYGNDIYRQDPRLTARLSAIDGFAIPGHNVQENQGSAAPSRVSFLN